MIKFLVTTCRCSLLKINNNNNNPSVSLVIIYRIRYGGTRFDDKFNDKVIEKKIDCLVLIT